jgi:hypothetical protein
MPSASDNYMLPQPVAEIVDAVCNRGKSRPMKFQPPHLQIPMDSGNGRTNILRAITARYYEYGVRDFSSRDHYLEFKMSGTVSNVYSVHAEIQGAAEYSNHYKGSIGFCIDDLMPLMKDAVGDKFLEMANIVRRHATLIIFTPSDSRKHFDIIADKIGVSLLSLPSVNPSGHDMAKIFYDNLPQKALDGQPFCLDFEKHEQAIVEFITETIPRPTMRTVIETAEAMHFNAETCKALIEKVGFEKEKGVSK